MIMIWSNGFGAWVSIHDKSLYAAQGLATIVSHLWFRSGFHHECNVNAKDKVQRLWITSRGDVWEKHAISPMLVLIHIIYNRCFWLMVSLDPLPCDESDRFS